MPRSVQVGGARPWVRRRCRRALALLRALGRTRPAPSARDGLKGPSLGLLAEDGDAGRGKDERAGAEREHPTVARGGEEDADQVGADQRADATDRGGAPGTGGPGPGRV